MNQSINIVKAAEHVKNLIDTNRCAVCDKPNGKRMRYVCGHTSCDDCVPATECCPFCLTQESSTCAAPSIDTPYSQRCQRASNLLEAFENELGVDVYKRHRLTEQLKVEKELFPQCIQAPAKYYNKRKSSKPFTENKENIITIFPGEAVSPIKMQNSDANVREWLNKCVKRKPLGDLNHSRTLINTIRKQPHKVINTQNIERSNRKRSYLEIWADDNKKIIDNQVAPSKKNNKENTIEKLEIKSYSKTDLKKNQNKDDSGISIDNDGANIIDDSQSVRVDKDMNAWLAVLEAEKYALCASTTLTSEPKLTQEIKQHKVPFYIKGPLCYNCEDCNDVNIVNNALESENQPNICITVESKSLTAIINVSKSERSNKINTKQSVEVQTDFVDQRLVDEKYVSYKVDNPRAFSPILSSSKSENQFLGAAHNSGLIDKSLIKSSNVVIAESDSDEEVHSTSLLVTADVHRSHEEILVLDDIEDLQEHSKRQRRAARGYTPTSTDSSDKENYNPNRTKKSSNSKKKPVKK